MDFPCFDNAGIPSHPRDRCAVYTSARSCQADNVTFETCECLDPDARLDHRLTASRRRACSLRALRQRQPSSSPCRTPTSFRNPSPANPKHLMGFLSLQASMAASPATLLEREAGLSFPRYPHVDGAILRPRMSVQLPQGCHPASLLKSPVMTA